MVMPCSLPPPLTLFSFSYSSLCATSKYGGISGTPHSPRHLSFMKQGPTLRHLRIHCTSPGSVKLVEHELWQREEKGLIGILPVQDVAEAATLDSVLSQGMGSDSGERSSRVQVCTSDSHRLDGWGKSAGTYSLSYKVYLNQNLFCYGLESVSILWVHNLTYR